MQTEFRQVVFDFLVRLLKPVCFFCIQKGFKFQEFSEAAKKAFVSAASDSVLEANKKDVSLSRLSIITGLQRRDISRLIQSSFDIKDEYNLLTKVIGAWQRQPDFSSRGNKPRKLVFEGIESEFAKLVSSVSQDLSHYSVLFELERLGIARKDGNTVELLRNAYSLSSDAKNGLMLLADDIGDLVSAVDENLFAQPTTPNLHLKTRYDNICLDKLQEIKDWFIQKGMELHSEARAYLSQFDRDLNPLLHSKKGGGRVTLGTFSRVEIPADIQEANQIAAKNSD
ncbi:MAG: hypothetical protein IT291_01770 [Deltaproteobacteria bacterium]|nr:hypothetical protein [Deltaproteobacteria bacterium]